jgi:hypothetical protein
MRENAIHYNKNKTIQCISMEFSMSSVIIHYDNKNQGFARLSITNNTKKFYDSKYKYIYCNITNRPAVIKDKK